MTYFIRPNIAPRELEMHVLTHLNVSSSGEDSQREKLVRNFQKVEPLLQTMFEPYFTKKDNSKFDEIIVNIDAFLKMFRRFACRWNPTSEFERTFWRKVVGRFKKDTERFNDTYLSHTVNYLVWEMEKYVA